LDSRKVNEAVICYYVCALTLAIEGLSLICTVVKDRMCEGVIDEPNRSTVYCDRIVCRIKEAGTCNCARCLLDVDISLSVA
jgi:hypothetical protein